jgi:hypothetical protein
MHCTKCTYPNMGSNTLSRQKLRQGIRVCQQLWLKLSEQHSRTDIMTVLINVCTRVSATRVFVCTYSNSNIHLYLLLLPFQFPFRSIPPPSRKSILILSPRPSGSHSTWSSPLPGWGSCPALPTISSRTLSFHVILSFPFLPLSFSSFPFPLSILLSFLLLH